MENSPFSPSSDAESTPPSPESDKKDKKDRKKSKAIGSLAFEQPKSVEEKAEKTPLAKMLEKPEDAAEKPVEKSDAEAEVQKSAPELSPDDETYVVHEIASQRQAEVNQEAVSDVPEEQAAHRAAQEFYERIVDAGLPLEAAAELVNEADPDADAEADTEADVIDAEPDSTPTRTPASPSSSAGSPPPPRPPRPPVNPNLPPQPANQPPIPNPMSYGASPSPNLPPTVTRTEYVPYYDRSQAFGDVLIGGIVGYLIGRRRGRIKTERKLLPVQRKLEREVKTLKSHLAETEFKVRENAKQQFRARQVAPRSTETFGVLKTDKTAAETVILDRRERPLPAPELHTKPNFAPPLERIGRVVIAAEARPTKPEATADTRSIEKQVETLSRNELMTLSEKVIVEGSTLRQVYETHLISERGLRRLIIEYLRGGDVVKAFRRELIEREIDFERDPKLRDTVRRNLTGGGAANSPTLHKLLQQAGVSPTEESAAELAQARAQQLSDAKQQSKRASQRKILDLSLVTIIAVLIAVIIVLAANKM